MEVISSRKRSGSFIHRVRKVKKGIERVTVVPFLCASGSDIQPLIVLLGKQGQ